MFDNGEDLAFGLNASSNLTVADDAIGGAGAIIASTLNAKLSRWHTCAISQSSSTSRTFMLDGQFQNNTTAISTLAIGATNLYAIGSAYRNSARTTGDDFQGRIECVFVWKRALSRAELFQLHKDPYQIILANPVKRFVASQTTGPSQKFGSSNIVLVNIFNQPNIDVIYQSNYSNIEGVVSTSNTANEKSAGQTSVVGVVTTNQQANRIRYGSDNMIGVVTTNSSANCKLGGRSNIEGIVTRSTTGNIVAKGAGILEGIVVTSARSNIIFQSSSNLQV
jgi:hypothetical protein